MLGHWNVLYFYPKDMTSGCTIEARDFQSLLKKFQNLGCQVIGVSKDSCASHQKFATKEGLNFQLLPDSSGEVCQAFDVWKEKSMYGKKFMGIERSTFLIHPSGEIVQSWHKVKVTGHAEEVLETLKNLSR
jgi:peroxiredoxin Q/BCP